MSAVQPYDYARRKGVKRISWARFVRLSAQLAEQLAAVQVDAVVGIARAGLLPAVRIACALRVDLFPARLTRREHDQVVRRAPEWKTDIPAEVRGRIVAVVDEIADTGETLALAAARARELGAAQVYTAVLTAHTWADPRPDFCALVSDALLIFPWDDPVYQAGEWGMHPELAAALGVNRH